MTTNAAYNFEVKSQLAKLLATENISMRHSPGATTAYFDVKDRVLVLPVWQNISEDLYDMLVVHEVGHALDTPFEQWIDSINKIVLNHHDEATPKRLSVVKAFLNIVEDARIDKRQKRRYPGSLRNYNIGYKELHDRDFFGVAKKDVNALPFIDRANIWFKHGTMYNIKFTSEDRKYIRRMETAETFEDVVALADDIYGYCIEIAKKEQEQKDNASNEDYESIDNGDDDAENMSIVTDIGEDFDEDGEESDLDNAFGGDDQDDDDQSVKTRTNDTRGSEDDKSSDDKTNLDIQEPVTETAAQEASKSIVLDEKCHYIYLKTPEFNYDAIIDDYKLVLAEMDAEYTRKLNLQFFSKNTITNLSSTLHQFRQDEKASLSFMIKEFEMRKSADTYARTFVAKTGVLNTNKLHSYKYNDDIFKRNNIVAEGKNHGFVIILDWSGSMIENVKATMKQLFSLSMFCKRAQIPFEVYLFRNHNGGGASYLKNYPNEMMVFTPFKLRNILSSRMTIAELNRAYMHLWLMAHNHRYECDDMDSTPLNEAILASDHIVNTFRKRNKLQIVNTIFLTDGGSDGVRTNSIMVDKANPRRPNSVGIRYFVRDHKTQKNYFLSSGLHGHKTTEVFLKMLKERTNSNVIGFFITKNLRSATMGIGYDTTAYVNLRKSWRDDNYVGLENAGYDEYYLINVNEMTDEKSLFVSSDMSKKAVIKEFVKFSSQKKTNRVMISKFMQRVCKAA